MSQQIWSSNTLGGYSATASIDAELRQVPTATTYFAQSAVGLSSYGKNRADKVLFDKMGRVVTALNTSGIGETSPIPVTTFPWVQGTCSTTEYANAVEWTEKLATYSQFPIATSVARVLRQDQIEGLDKVAFAAFALGKVIYVTTSATGGSFTTNGTPAGVATNAMNTSHVKDVSDYLRKHKVPALMAGRYMCIAHVDHTRGIKNSSDFIGVSQFSSPERLYNSEVGELYGIRFVEENNALASPSGNNTAGFAEAIYFGSDDVVQAAAVAPHIRYKIPGEYGRDLGEASYTITGYVLVWRYDTDGGQENQVYAKSA